MVRGRIEKVQKQYNISKAMSKNRQNTIEPNKMTQNTNKGYLGTES
jgi:hypothetical protein